MITRIVCGLSLVLISAITFAEEHPKLSPELRNRQGESAIEVIVQFHKRPQNGRTMMAAKIAEKGGQVRHDMSFVHAVHASVPASRLAELEKDGEVDYILAQPQAGQSP